MAVWKPQATAGRESAPIRGRGPSLLHYTRSCWGFTPVLMATATHSPAPPARPPASAQTAHVTWWVAMVAVRKALALLTFLLTKGLRAGKCQALLKGPNVTCLTHPDKHTMLLEHSCSGQGCLTPPSLSRCPPFLRDSLSPWPSRSPTFHMLRANFWLCSFLCSFLCLFMFRDNVGLTGKL